MEAFFFRTGVHDFDLHIALSALLGPIPLVLSISDFILCFGVGTHALYQ